MLNGNCSSGSLNTSEYTTDATSNITLGTDTPETNDFKTAVDNYMKCSKRTLAELLALKDLADKALTPRFPIYPTYPIYPQQPIYPEYPWWTYQTISDLATNDSKYYNCSDWKHCSNPHHDCVNCPLHKQAI